MNLGYIFTFILGAYTTITTILPSLLPNTQSSENDNQIYRFQALYTLLNRSSSTGNILSANITLHQVRDVQNPTAKMLALLAQEDEARLLMRVTGVGHYPALLMVSETGDINRFPEPNVLLSYAAMNYNNNQKDNAEDLINHIQCGEKNSDCLQKVWYFNRTLNINKPNNNNVVHEDRDCTRTKWTCTQEELVKIDKKISNLSQSGYNLQFYNDMSPVDFLEKRLETFVFDLHSLIIISLIIVVIVVLAKGTILIRLFTRTV